jgi:hypothetical protein
VDKDLNGRRWGGEGGGRRGQGRLDAKRLGREGGQVRFR